MKQTEVVYFRFPVRGPACLHKWLSGLQHVVEDEIAATLRCLSATGTATPDQQEILVYLHYMYFYRFALPAIEASFSTESERCDPTLARFQLLCCLLGRFLDDTVDRDSGFWSTEQAVFWVKVFTRRCESACKGFGRGKDASTAWLRCLELGSTVPPPLIRRVGTTAGICVSEVSPLTVETYPERVPYYFWLPRWHGTHSAGTSWLESYIQALFYWYDIDDVLNDILNNVPTDPAYHFLRATIDSEGRIKALGGRVENALAELKTQGLARLVRCAEHGRKLGLLLGPAMIDREIRS